MKRQACASAFSVLGLILLMAGYIGCKMRGLGQLPLFLNTLGESGGLFIAAGALLIMAGAAVGNYYCKACWKPYLLILPAMAFLLIFVLYPILNVIYLSFFKGSVLNPAKEFVGLKNYISMFNKTAFQTAVRNTLLYAISLVILVIFLSMLMARWLFENRKLNKICQTAIFTPHLIATVSCAFIWRWIMDFNSYGLLNTALGIFGIAPVAWLESSDTALLSVIVMNTWKNIGYYTLIMIAAMKSIPAEIYEAAELDNASGTKRFFRITLPMISPQLFFILVLMTIGSFNVFDSVNAMTGGGPGSSTEVIARFIYLFAFKNNNTLGLGCSAAVFLMSLQLVMTVLYFKLLEKRVHYQ